MMMMMMMMMIIIIIIIILTWAYYGKTSIVTRAYINNKGNLLKIVCR